MESEEDFKFVDAVYKNILDKFNPGAKQLISAGKAYLKALHGASAAQTLYLEALKKIAKESQTCTTSQSSSNIGTHLQEVVEVQKEIQALQLNVLKAFYLDLLVPLEANLEKDGKAIQVEQKKFVQSYRQYHESYQRAATVVKKFSKKHSKASRNRTNIDKEIKELQRLEEEKERLEGFCEQSKKTAMYQERRRYGFILERQCSLARHWLSMHSRASALYDRDLGTWLESANSRDTFPEKTLINRTKAEDQSLYGGIERSSSRSTAEELDMEERFSMVSHLRKSRSLDASSCLDDHEEERLILETSNPTTYTGMSRARSDYNLLSSSGTESTVRHPRPRSLALDPGGKGLARALYAYLSSGENQLSFLENDTIFLLGDRNKGWQYGENTRTGRRGWFPVAYIEVLETDDMDSGIGHPSNSEALCVPTDGSSPFVNRLETLSFNGNSKNSQKSRKLRESHSLQSSKEHCFLSELRHPSSTEGKTTPASPITPVPSLLICQRTCTLPLTSSRSPKAPKPVPLPTPGNVDGGSKYNSLSSSESPAKLILDREWVKNKDGSLAEPEGRSLILPPDPTPPPSSLNNSDDSGFSLDGHVPQTEVDYANNDEIGKSNVKRNNL
ncbi:BAR/IMD domain-containing adapter protein 2-like isoform X2 [Artemia franciscana]|uniref:BAR/IMD domain-containing adapter protein 2-like isoform X2 n=1 Tax=Artemia franciscana TaxID=6661 RepID=UPI0032DA55FD